MFPPTGARVGDRLRTEGQDRGHILEGLVALSNVDEIIALIGGADPADIKRPHGAHLAQPVVECSAGRRTTSRPEGWLRNTASPPWATASDAQAQTVLETTPPAPDRPGAGQDRQRGTPEVMEKIADLLRHPGPPERITAIIAGELAAIYERPATVPS